MAQQQPPPSSNWGWAASFASSLASAAAAAPQQQQQQRQQPRSPRRPHVLLVFVHGFMGSSESFHGFPRDLLTALRDDDSGGGNRNDLFSPAATRSPTYVTKSYDFTTAGDNAVRVAELASWLTAQATTETADAVVLLAHSMGGLLSADAAKSLLLDDAAAAAPTVPIIAILAYDSPFFGLHPNVFLHTGTQRVTAAWSSVSNLLGSPAAADAASRAARSFAPSSSTSAAAATTTTASSSSSSSSTSFWGAAMAIVAVGAAAVAVSSHPVVKEKLQQGADAVMQRAEFLGPLWRVEGQSERMDWLVRSTAEGRLGFRCFYMKTPFGDPGSGDSTYFIQPPKEQYQHLFRAVPVRESDARGNGVAAGLCKDEIDVHVHMFDTQMGLAYIDLIQETTREVRAAVARARLGDASARRSFLF
ncbi:hypothetical protein DFJ73DRAFT_797932 [Zopfochytrium polystomum]|nr:hypothetical protein DFJ73DRAFT_797932 [Zopfochytrium polystomum]